MEAHGWPQGSFYPDIITQLVAKLIRTCCYKLVDGLDILTAACILLAHLGSHSIDDPLDLEIGINRTGGYGTRTKLNI